MTETIRDASLAVPNPRTAAQAVHWCWEEIHLATHWKGECDHVVALAYGYKHSGEEDARAHLAEQHLHPLSVAHTGDLVWWKIGEHDHVAVLANHHTAVYSIDVRKDGQLSLVPITEVNEWLNAKPVGASVPYFPHGVRH